MFNKNYILYWNHAALELIRLTHTNTASGPINGPPLAARMLGILHLAIHDAYFASNQTASVQTYLDPGKPMPYTLPTPPPLADRDAKQAVAGAAITVLRAQYTTPDPTISTAAVNQANQLLQQHTTAFPGLHVLSVSYQFGVEVGNAVLNLLAIKPNEPGTKTGAYHPPPPGQYRYGIDPTNPLKVLPVDPNDPNGPKVAVTPHHAPFYGMTAKRLGVQYKVGSTETEHILADPPVLMGNTPEYTDAFKDVYRMGGQIPLNSTKRRPWQTAAAHFWAYDAANLIGVPPRMYNQIMRKVAWENRLEKNDPESEQNNADFARLFALANVAMADAGIFAWQEKYCFEFWRPLSGVRDDTLTKGSNGELLQDPFWLELGAPSTNSNDISFKPPFPSYPSGHATFGGAVFQTMRLYYKKRNNLAFDDHEADQIAFDFVSDELDGISRDLRMPYDATKKIENQPGIVRTYWPRHFSSLWEAMHENALSRVWLGVHWRFDAFAAKDVLVHNDTPSPQNDGLYEVEMDGSTKYKPAAQVTYGTMGTRADRAGQKFPIGGVPLGIGIADDIFCSGLKPTPAEKQPSGRYKCGDRGVVS